MLLLAFGRSSHTDDAGLALEAAYRLNMGAGTVAIPDEMLMISPFRLPQSETEGLHFGPMFLY